MVDSLTPTIVDREAFIRAQRAHLEHEKALTRQRDAVAARRRALPWTEVTEPYRFRGPDGERSLADLFEGRSQLLIYHFMYGPDWDAGCPSCSFWADTFDHISVHLAHRDTAFAAVSIADLDRITAYRERMGWSFDWYSSAGSRFNYDMGVSFTPEQTERGEPVYNFGTLPAGGEQPGASAFRRTEDGRVFLTYQTFARGLELVNGAYHWLDLTSLGRDEEGLEWPMAWLRRHDEYGA